MKDPAVLFYIGDWLTGTATMDADCRGWYLNLILHNYDKGCLPNDIETLAVLCNVKFSEYERFKQVFEQVLLVKFEILENGCLSNLKAQQILKSRETFKDKRSEAGKKSYLVKFFNKFFPKEFKNSELKEFILSTFDLSLDLKDEQIIKQVFKQMFELYKNENEIKNLSEVKLTNEIPELSEFLEYAKNVYENDLGLKFSDYKFSVESKYQSWIDSNWKDGNNKQIKIWKTKLKNTIPHLKAIYNGQSNNQTSGASSGSLSGRAKVLTERNTSEFT